MEILVWDYKRNTIRNEQHNTVSLFVKNTSLLGIVSGDASNSVYDLYAGAANSQAQFKSGWLGEGGLIIDKVQDECIIAYKGTVNFKLYINETLAVDQDLNSEGVAVQKFKFPSNSIRNNFVEIELTGTGEVYEIDIPQESANA